jgi:hypothetical protein
VAELQAGQRRLDTACVLATMSLMTPREPSNRRAASSGNALVREIGGIVLGQLRGALAQRSPLAKSVSQVPQKSAEPPVVAQLMIEIRADGSRTIARGALNDLRNGESAQVHAEGRTPAELMLSLANSLLALPASMLRQARRPDTDELPRDVAGTSGTDPKR